MDKIEKIRKEIAQLKGVKLYTFSDILSEEPDKSLEEYASRAGFDYVDGIVQEEPGHRWNDHDVEFAYRDGIIAGAKWQADQFEKNRLADCDGLTKEEYDRETDFALEIINKEHRQPTFTDAINYGMRLQKEHMLKEAVEKTVGQLERQWGGNIHFMHGFEVDEMDFPFLNSQECGYGDKVRIIVCKKED